MNRFKLWFLVLLAVPALFLSSCAVDVEESAADTQRRIYNAYINANGYSTAELIGDGVRVVERKGIPTGSAPVDSSYAMIKYSARYTSGEYISTNYDTVAIKIGTHKVTNCYDSYVWPVGMSYISDGLDTLVKSMHPGEKVVAIIPPWLSNVNNSTAYSSSSAIVRYEIEMTGCVSDIMEYQAQKLQDFSDKFYNKMDTTQTGFYFKKIHASNYKDTLTDGTNINVRYVGRYLNGQLFDTNIADTAKKYGIYIPDYDYQALNVLYYKDIDQMVDEASLVSGFCQAILCEEMTYGDKCITFFDSDWGYGSTGSMTSGDGIPPFYPLFFEIWIEEYE